MRSRAAISPLSILAVLLLAAACSEPESTGTTSDGAISADTGPGGDGAPADAAIADAAKGPWANIYKSSPVDDQRKTSMAKLANITDTAGKLSGSFTRVYNCMPDATGQKVSVNYSGLQLSGIICTQRQTASPGSDGTYLHIKPPASDTDGKDAFAEVMMYHHINTIHDHYTNDFGLTHINSKALRAVVNLQAKVDLWPTWLSLGNAAYMPKSSADLLKKQYGVDLLQGEDGIIFGYNNLYPPTANFAYDASVIYHEYTHYCIGGALWNPAADQYGLDPTPKGLNEALSDYFPSSFLDNPKLGAYALGSSARDLTRDLRCPEHIVGEEHVDGEVASGALWAARKVVGAKLLDKAIWAAVLTFTASTTFEEASKAILDEVGKVASDKAAAVKQIFQTRGFSGCVRLTDHKDIKAGSRGSGYAGTSGAPSSFSTWVPGYMQYKIPVAKGTQEVTIKYTPQSGGLYGFGSTKGDVSVALKKGSSAILYDYTSGKAVSDADSVLKGADDGTGYKLVLSGDCIAEGSLVYQFINNGKDSGEVTVLTVTQSATKTNTTDNFTGCK